MTIDVTAGLTPTGATDSVIANARSLRERLRAHAATADSNRQLDADDVDAMTDAGLMSLWTPRAFGGPETSFRTAVEVAIALGEGDAAAGWLAGVSNAGSFVMSLFSERAQAEVWAGGPHVRGAGVLAPAGRTEVAPGGMKLTGRWPYMSGVTTADWVFVTAPVGGSLGPGAQLGFFLVPREEIVVDDTWFVTGMRATASSTAVVNDVYVPEHRILRWSAYDASACKGIYRSHIYSVLNVGVVSTLVGELGYALELVLEKAASRPIVTTMYRSQAESAAFQVEVGRAAQIAETARLRMLAVADDMDRIVAEARLPTSEEKTKNRADCAYIAQACWDAVDTLASAHGTSTFSQSNPLERVWRNAAVASRHAGLSLRVGNEVFGRELLGIETQSIAPTL
ncbi:acyl-CoA dehydrogenase family protein [Microbacterium sp. LWS13-1.2]|uniref:Acyl-CoA dehydrogenase family protein n=1 Tax=Microbacterium sp. LWS13-1.2 TaxID=3135264 RepID=A0AAU6SBA6_9MICO